MKPYPWMLVLLWSAAAAVAAKKEADPVAPPPAAAPAAKDAAAGPEAKNAAPAPAAPEEQGPAFDAMDLDKDGGVTWNEFLVGQAVASGKPAAHAATLPAKEQTRIKKAFKEADQDRSSILTEKEWSGYGEAQLAAKAPPETAGDKEKELEEKREYYRRMMRRQMR
ncbi:MAG: hypothetical protein FJ221_03545 [Lentisphaerae bacterium]|nr:hypothetical protein [Lentisphaerota bacterium]